jgi:hypothetical protein
VTTTATVLLGVIAAATLLMAIIQVGAIVYAGRLARRVDRLAVQVEQELKPLVASLASVSQNAVRASSLAVAQVERVDRLFEDLTVRMDQTLGVLQGALTAPAREGRAVLAAVRAVVRTFVELRRARARMRAEDEDALFIG